MLIEIAEVIGAWHEVDFVGWPGKITDGELVVGMMLVEEGFEMPIAAFGIEEEISDEGDARSFFQLKRQCGFYRSCGLRAR